MIDIDKKKTRSKSTLQKSKVKQKFYLNTKKDLYDRHRQKKPQYFPYVGERSVNTAVLTYLTSSESSSFTFMMLERSWCFKGIIIESVRLLSSQSATVAVFSGCRIVKSYSSAEMSFTDKLEMSFLSHANLLM